MTLKKNVVETLQNEWFVVQSKMDWRVPSLRWQRNLLEESRLTSAPCGRVRSLAPQCVQTIQTYAGEQGYHGRVGAGIHNRVSWCKP